MNTFQALIVDKNENGEVIVDVGERNTQDLPAGDVLIKVHYSSVNYKDGLASIPNGNIVSEYPIIPGIDLAGVVESSEDERFKQGAPVIVTSYELGVSHDGGFSEYARVPSDWVVPLPEGMTLKESMVYGTAGFTSALSVIRLEEEGVLPDSGPVLVTGATGGVGSMAVAMLSRLGYEVIASTGTLAEKDFLKSIGASEIISREEVHSGNDRPLNKQRWAGAVDPVGGESLSTILSSLKYNGTVAVSGLTGGVKFPATVFPFILRGINLVGIDSVHCPMDRRKKVWKRLAGDLHIQNHLEKISEVVTLQQLPEVLQKILKGQVNGRKVVKLS